MVVGAGFAGIYAVHAFRSAGLTVRAFEAGSGIGGTWFWNCYPGARCDVESKDYSYSFSPELEQEWSWSERYPAQPEVLRYLNHVADRFGLWPDIQLSTRVTAAIWDDETSLWQSRFAPTGYVRGHSNSATAGSETVSLIRSLMNSATVSLAARSTSTSVYAPRNGMPPPAAQRSI